LTPEELPVKTCKESGCYMTSPGDLTHRFKHTYVLKNGQTWTAYGDACIHNTTRIAKKSLKRVAETRAKARAGRDAINCGVPCIVEISSFEGEVRQGDRILSQEDMDSIVVEGSVVHPLVKSPVTGTPTPKMSASELSSKATEAMVESAAAVLAEAAKEEEMPKEYNFKDERTKQNALLHGEFSRLGLDVKAAHNYIHRMDKVASLKELDAAKLADWVNNFSQIRLDSPNHARIKEMVGGAGVKT